MMHRRRFRALAALIIVAAPAIVVPETIAAEGSDAGVRVVPAIAIPLGEDAAFFGAGATGQVRLFVAPGFAPWLAPGLSAGYTFGSLELETSLSVLNAGADLSLGGAGDGDIALSIGGGGGYYYALLNNGEAPGVGAAYVDAHIGASIPVAKQFSLLMEAGYRSYAGLAQYLTISFGGTIHRSRPQAQIQMQPVISPIRPLEEASNAELLRIRGVDFDEVFPVFFKYYDEHPVGAARVTNATDQPITDLSMTFQVGQYMDSPTVCGVSSTLPSRASHDVAIMGLFNDSVTQITESTKVAAEIVVSFTHNDVQYTQTYSSTVRLHDRNAMTWDDDRKAAAFVTPRDPSVLTFAKHVASVVSDGPQSPIPEALRIAMALHAAVDQYGITYTVDPDSPVRNRGEAAAVIDYIQFPRQTLQYKGGDCDDLSILYAALLQSLGYQTAFALVPGHIFMAVDTGLTESEAQRQFPDTSRLVIRDDRAWVPIEVTLIDDGFLRAWTTAVNQWREAESRHAADFLITADAWDLYEPVGLLGEGQPLALPDLTQLTDSYQRQLTAYVDQAIYSSVAELQEEIQETNGSPRAVNRLAVLYARYGLYDRAAEQFRQILDRRPNYVPAIVNIANIQMLQGDLGSALESFGQALELDDENPTILISAARVNHQMQNYGSASRLYNQAREIDPALAGRYAYLDMQGEEGTRAAEQQQGADSILWEVDE